MVYTNIYICKCNILCNQPAISTIPSDKKLEEITIGLREKTSIVNVIYDDDEEKFVLTTRKSHVVLEPAV